MNNDKVDVVFNKIRVVYDTELYNHSHFSKLFLNHHTSYIPHNALIPKYKFIELLVIKRSKISQFCTNYD